MVIAWCFVEYNSKPWNEQATRPESRLMIASAYMYMFSFLFFFLITFLVLTTRCGFSFWVHVEYLCCYLLAVAGLTDTTVFCSPGLCQHHGVCHELVRAFRCDCNMTSFVGRTCTDGMLSSYRDSYICMFIWFCFLLMSDPVKDLPKSAIVNYNWSHVLKWRKCGWVYFSGWCYCDRTGRLLVWQQQWTRHYNVWYSSFKDDRQRRDSVWFYDVGRQWDSTTNWRRPVIRALHRSQAGTRLLCWTFNI